MCRTIYQTNKSHQWLTKMSLPVFCFVLFTVTVTSGFILGPGHLCRQCDAAIHPSSCMKTGRCLKDQECYTETYTASDSTQLYRLGCISAHICRISVQSTFNDTGCFSCCQTENCNANLCPSSTCKKPYFGPVCTDICGHCANHEQCNKITGRCLNGCEGAHVPPYCRSTSPTVCSKPFYGTYCTETCGHCSSGEQCDKDTGRCPNGCDLGFMAPYCNSVCPRHSYGPDCRYICGKCAGEDVCDPQSGVCRNGCEPGFIPPLCSGELRVVGDDCSTLKLENNFTVNGIYPILYAGRRFEVWCDMVTEGKGWIVFQRRVNDSVTFNRTWAEYKNGFGSKSGSFWWGNDNLATTTSKGNYVLRIDMKDIAGHYIYAEYQNFSIENEQGKYRLHLGTYNGNAGAFAMTYHNEQMFSTIDQDNDNNNHASCAVRFSAGWWWNDCFAYVNLNGLYTAPQVSGSFWLTHGIYWYEHDYSNLKWTEMKFRSA